MTVTFTLVGAPQGKGRPKFARRGKFVSVYTPKETVTYEQMIRDAYMSANKLFRFGDKAALYVRVEAYYPIPKSMPKKNRLLAIAAALRPTVKPDCDNVLKCVCDALNGLAWRDDAQVVSATIEKLYGDTPRVEVTITDGEEESL